ncbi:TldD/PmbA family protein [Candidatus Woesearchaeota archaeon]|nr:TldD/PmbA family protein [Candidatus Woesearchaeota archaeon]
MVDHRVIEALDALAGTGIRYADARMVYSETRGCSVYDNDPYPFYHGAGRGIGVRVLYDNGWGFSSGPLIDRKKIADKALERAKISAAVNEEMGHKIRLSPITTKGDFEAYAQVEENPFAISQQRIVRDVLVIAETCKKPWVDSVDYFVEFDKVRNHFANTEGVRSEQEFVYVNSHLGVHAQHEGELISRTFEGFANTFLGGYELFNHGLNLEEHAERICEELKELKSAPRCPQGVMDVILDPSQLYLQIHENGHGFELDRILGWEIDFAGGSFLKPEHLGKLKYGSDKVNIVASAGEDWGAGTFAFDDEGIPGQKIYLVKEGVVNNFLSSRETVMEANLPKDLRYSTGTMRAENESHIPLIRMTNVSLEAGNDGSIEDIISRTEEGILFKTNKTWSIDNLRLNFDFGAEVGWIIENGEKKHMIRTPSYQGETVSFWNSCVDVGDKVEDYGVMNCGKGQPCQAMRCGHGTPPARFENVRVGTAEPGFVPTGSCRIKRPYGR